mgnify:CR=1 FL=1
MRHALLWRLLGYLRPYWVGLVALLVLMGAGAFLEVLPAEITRRFIERHISTRDLTGSSLLLLKFLGFLVAGFLVSLTRYILLAWVGQKAMLDLRMQLFEHRMARFTNQIEDTMKIRKTRREIARVHTVLSARKGAAKGKE